VKYKWPLHDIVVVLKTFDRIPSTEPVYRVEHGSSSPSDTTFFLNHFKVFLLSNFALRCYGTDKSQSQFPDELLGLHRRRGPYIIIFFSSLFFFFFGVWNPVFIPFFMILELIGFLRLGGAILFLFPLTEMNRNGFIVVSLWSVGLVRKGCKVKEKMEENCFKRFSHILGRQLVR
jgi:hypothetical protein